MVLKRVIPAVIKSAVIYTCLCIVEQNAALAQQVPALPIEDELKVRYFAEYSPIDYSPDGKWLAYVTRDNQRSRDVGVDTYARTGVPIIGVGADVCISNTETRQTRCLTGGKGDNWMPSWSPDGHYLAFVSDRDGTGQARVWAWDTNKDELRAVSGVNVRADGTQIEWTRDGRSLLVTTLPEELSPETYAERLSSGQQSEDRHETSASGSRVFVYEGNAKSLGNDKHAGSDPWNLDVTLRDLTSVDVATGRAKRITTGQRIAWYSLSPDGTRIAYTIPKRFEKPGSQQILFDLAMVNLLDKKRRILASDIRLDHEGVAFSWSPNGSQLAFHTGGVEERRFDCYIVDANRGDPRNVSGLAQRVPSHTTTPPLWDANGENIYFLSDGALWQASVNESKAVKVGQISDHRMTSLISQSTNLLWTVDRGKSTIVVAYDEEGRQDGLFKIDLGDGESQRLLERAQCYTCASVIQQFVVAKDHENVAYFAEDAQRPSDLWTSDSSFRSPRQLTHLNPQFDSYRMGIARLIDWLSDDGERLQGVLLLPGDYQEGKRYPLIVWVYGGSFLSNYRDQFGLGGTGPFNLQLLATRGYAILLPDAPQHLGTPMLDLVKTVLPGVNRVIEMGIGDPNKLGVMGHSYGGYSALSLIVQTKRFKAAIIADGIADWVSAYGQMSKDGTAFQVQAAERGQGLIGGAPWELPQRFIENSPLFYLDRIETPVLVIHGAEDASVASFLGDELFVGLRRLAKDVEYAKYPGEGHAPPDWGYADQVDCIERIITWFNRYLRSEDHKEVM